MTAAKLLLPQSLTVLQCHSIGQLLEVVVLYLLHELFSQGAEEGIMSADISLRYPYQVPSFHKASVLTRGRNVHPLPQTEL